MNPGAGPRGRRGPKPLGEVLGALVAARGFGRLQGQAELEAAWAGAIGEPARLQTRVGALRRGVLNITVAHPALHAELAGFRKPALLAALRQALPGLALHDLRFRVGPIE